MQRRPVPMRPVPMPRRPAAGPATERTTTTEPGRRLWRPSTTTRSPGLQARDHRLQAGRVHHLHGAGAWALLPASTT